MDSTVSTPKPREQGQIPGKYFRYIFQKGLRAGEIKVLRREARQMSNESIGKSWSQTEITREAKAQAAEKRRDVASTENKALGALLETSCQSYFTNRSGEERQTG